MRLVTIALAASAVLATPAFAADLPAKQCFRSQEIRNHTIETRSTLLVNVRGKEVYRVAMKGSCLAGATSSDPIIMRSPPGAPLICKPIDLDIAISKGGFASPCLVDSITRLSPEEVAALPKKLKP